MSVWSDDLYQRFNLPPESLSREKPSPEQTNIQLYIIDKACSYLDEALGTTQQLLNRHSLTGTPAIRSMMITTSNKEFARTISVYAATRLAQLKRWQKHRTNLLDEYSTLTPLRKYWIAMRTERRIKN